jgi:hypothetical protein
VGGSLRRLRLRRQTDRASARCAATPPCVDQGSTGARRHGCCSRWERNRCCDRILLRGSAWQLEAILEKGSEGSSLEELKDFSKTVTCERLGPVIVAAVDRFNAEAAERGGPAVNSLELVRAAQVELARLGCFDGKINGSLTTTEDALARYMTSQGRKLTNPDITEALVADLAEQADRICPMLCKSGEISKGNACIANASPPESVTTTRREGGREGLPGRQSEATREHLTKLRTAEGTPLSPSGGHSAGANSMVGVGF